MNAPIAGFCAAAALGLGWLAGQEHSDAESRPALSEFMGRKLDRANGLLDGLSRRDLAAVARQADSLGLVCLDLSWNVLQTDEYLERSTTFRRTVATMAAAARDRQLERAELAYLDLAGQCFSCHAYVRDRK